MLLFRHVDCHHLIDHAARGERLDDRWSFINARCSDKTYIERRRQDLNPVVCVLGVSGEKGETAVWEAGEKDIRRTTNEANASKNKYSFDRVQPLSACFFSSLFFSPPTHRTQSHKSGVCWSLPAQHLLSVLGENARAFYMANFALFPVVFNMCASTCCCSIVLLATSQVCATAVLSPKLVAHDSRRADGCCAKKRWPLSRYGYIRV